MAVTAPPFVDLRSFLDALAQRELLARVDAPVDWDLEVGAIQRVMFDRGGPALQFDNVRDAVCPLVTGVLGTPERYALGVGCEPHMRAIINKVRAACDKPIDPIVVPRGPCQENVLEGEQIDLHSLPVPKWHDEDGGRYLGTLGLVICRDPETGVQNVGIHREMILGRDTLSLNATQQVGIILHKYRKLGRKMPIATVVGVDPSSLAATCVQARLGVDELSIAGGMMGRPVEMVRCATQDLDVPATAEFVFEGEVDPEAALVSEGPFGEYAGYYGPATEAPVIELTAVTHRDDPIFQGTLEGAPPNESTMLRLPGNAAALGQYLEAMKVPAVEDVYFTDMGCAEHTIIVSLKEQAYFGIANQVVGMIWSFDPVAKWVILVNSDIDVYDRKQVEWALATRVQPHRDIWVTPANQPGIPLDPSISPENSSGQYSKIARSSRVAIDATVDYKDYDFGTLARPRTVPQVLERWDELGLPALD
jgi:UbiD family decarboxylase